MCGKMGVTAAIVLFVLFDIGTSGVNCAHFRGGTMSWKPTRQGNQVEVMYSMGFNGFREPNEDPPSGHTRCSKQAKDSNQLLSTTGYLKCDGCEVFYSKKMQWRCTDFDEAAGWDIGGDSITITVPDVNNKVVMYHEKCCWVGPLKNAPEYHPHQGYKMMTEIDLRPRRDNGLINSSPMTSPIPVQLFHSGCKYHLEIPVTDPDNDAYRCRYTSGWDKECYKYSNGKYGDICDGLSYINVYDNCTLEFDTRGGKGYYAVRVMIEDLDQNGDPMSKISLSFLLEVSEDDSTCKSPIIVSPPSVCKTIPVGQLYEEMVLVEAASEQLPIQRIETSKPSGMNVSESLQPVPGNSLRKSATLSWIPTNEQIGRHTVGFNAVDQKGFSSGWSFMYLNVAEAELLHPVSRESTPSDGAEIRTLTGWIIRFNRDIRRPTHSAYITLLDSTGIVTDIIDTSRDERVSFSDREITFSVSLSNLHYGMQEFRLKLDAGIAIDAEHENCMLYSHPEEWTVFIQGAQKPATRAPTTIASRITPPTTPPIFECTPGNTDITPPIGTEEGKECFIHLEESRVTVTQGSLNVPYKLCCPGDCGDAGPPGNQGPPGTI